MVRLVVVESHELKIQQTPIRVPTTGRSSVVNSRMILEIDTDSQITQPAQKSGVRTVRSLISKSTEGEKVFKYSCPLYKSTLRLSDSETEPVDVLVLETLRPTRHWVKRGVALIMESDN